MVSGEGCYSKRLQNYLRAIIELDKPLRRGVLLRMSRNEEAKWFQAQYENSRSTAMLAGCWVIQKWNVHNQWHVMNKVVYHMMSSLGPRRRRGGGYNPSPGLLLNLLGVDHPQRRDHLGLGTILLRTVDQLQVMVVHTFHHQVLWVRRRTMRSSPL